MNKKLITWVVVIVAVVLLAWLAWYIAQSYAPSYSPATTYQNSSDQTTGDNGSQNTATSQGTGGGYLAVASTLSYANALHTYADKRIQFSSTCAASPYVATFKKGAVIMLDNRANKARTIALDSTVFNVKAYGFILVQLSPNVTLPHAILVDCGHGENNATINLEK